MALSLGMMYAHGLPIDPTDFGRRMIDYRIHITHFKEDGSLNYEEHHDVFDSRPDSFGQNPDLEYALLYLDRMRRAIIEKGFNAKAILQSRDIPEYEDMSY